MVERFMIEKGQPFDEEKALSIKSVANQTYLEITVLSSGIVY